jgi:hypothetical protein
MVTVKQVVAIAAGRAAPPYHANGLRTRFHAKPLSLRSVMNGVGSQNIVVMVSIREVSILQGVKTFDELRAKWRSSAPTRANLLTVLQAVNAAGGSVKSLSRTWQTVALSGNVSSFGGLSTIRLASADLADLGHSLGIVGGSMIAIGAIPEPGSPILVIGGAAVAGAGAGLLFGNFVGELIFGSEPAPGGEPSIPEVTVSPDTGQVVTPHSVDPGPDGQFTIPEVTIYGTLPSGEPPGVIFASPVIDEITIPSEPPAPPDSGPDPGGGTPDEPSPPIEVPPSPPIVGP